MYLHDFIRYSCSCHSHVIHANLRIVINKYYKIDNNMYLKLGIE